MSRKKYIIEGINSIEDIIDVREYYRFSLNGINYVIHREFIENRFAAMKFESEPRYFGYTDNYPPFMLNGLFLPVGVGMDYDFKLKEVKI